MQSGDLVETENRWFIYERTARRVDDGDNFPATARRQRRTADVGTAAAQGRSVHARSPLKFIMKYT